MKYMLIVVIVLSFSAFTYAFFNKNKLNYNDKSKNIYDYTIHLIDGQKKMLSDYKGKKIIFVNVASKCGYTSQYKQLQTLYEKYNKSVIILGFPANDFLWQEPAKNKEIETFCSTNYGVTFPLVQKTVVKKNNNQHPVYTWLSHSSLNGWNDSAPGWNFYKYIVDENGNLLDVFPSKVKPLDEKIIKFLEG